MELSRGKAKTLFTVKNQPQQLIMHFRDDTSAFNGNKIESIPGKGRLNNLFNHHIMQHLRSHHIATHHIQLINDTDSLVHSLTMLPIECVIRNRSTGSLCKRLGIPENQILDPPLFEFFLKNDSLGDPLITESHILTFNWATRTQAELMKSLSMQVNRLLLPLFQQAGYILVDFKLEFGYQPSHPNNLFLADEFTLDGCRLWDSNTLEKMDKDRFRHNLGNVLQSYQTVATKLGIPHIHPS